MTHNYNLTVVNVRPGEKQTVPVVPSGRYCIMELPMGDDFDTEIRYTREFIAEEDSNLGDTTTPHVNIIISKTQEENDKYTLIVSPGAELEG